MILINKNTILLQKMYTSSPVINIGEWMKEVDLNDHVGNQEDLKEWGRQMIREIKGESCILFLEGVVEECNKIIQEHYERCKEIK